ncbi:MAG: choice-of-anchor J domain-containing protein [Bacteroidales bacterium]|nr:choice-of-anchor J domain-containing protein [Bacteroidales bacterium]
MKAIRFLPLLMAAAIGVGAAAQTLRTTLSNALPSSHQGTNTRELQIVRTNLAPAIRLGVPSLSSEKRHVSARPNQADYPVLYGLKHADSGYNDVSGGPYNVIRFHAAPSTTKRDVSPELGGSTAFYARGKFYTLEMEGTQCIMKTYDASTWELESTNVICERDDYLRQVAAFDETTGKAYFVFWGEIDWNTYRTARPLMEIDLDTKTATEVGKIDQIFVQTLFFDNKGQLYGIPYNTKELYRINKADGSYELVGELDIPFGRYPNSETAVTDPATGITYWIVPRVPGDGYAAESYIYTIDCETFQCTLLSDMPNDEHLQGAFIKYAPAEAPAAATSISYEAGKLHFTAPTTTYTTGEALTGSLSAHIVVDGAEQTLSLDPGAEAEVQLNLADGDHEAIITVEGQGGIGPERIWEGFIGNDQPTGVENLTATLDGNTVTVTWSAPTASINGGAFDDADVRYNVLRHPDEVVLAEATTATNLTDELPTAHNHYTWEVTSFVGEMTGNNVSVTSNDIVSGSIWVPDYTEEFRSQDDWNLFTVIDNNADGAGWKYQESQQTAYLLANGMYDPDFNPEGGKGMDDYLITPSIKLQKDVQYRLSFDAIDVGLTHEYLNVYLGQGNTIEAMTTTLAKYDFDYRNDNLQQTTDFSVTADGLWNIAFHCCAPVYSSNYALDNIGIEVYSFFDAPAASSNVSVIPGAGGALSSTLTFTLPTTTFKGDVLSEISSVEIRRNGQRIATLEGKPGETLTFEDTTVNNGEAAYTITCFNAVGQGAPASVTIWVGLDTPIAPVINEFHQTADIKPSVSWSAVPASGAHGGYVVPEEVTYTLCKYNAYNWENPWEQVATTTDLTTIDETFFSYWGQDLVTYALFASNEAGTSEGTQFSITLGSPWETPYQESFAWAFANQGPWTLFASSYDYAWSINDGSSLAVKPYDEDGGMLYYTYKAEDSNSQIMQGPRVALGTLTKAELSFFMYHGMEADPEDVVLEVLASYNDGEWQKIGTVDYNNGATGWARSSFALETPAAPEGYSPSNVQIAFRGITTVPSASLFIDKISIADGVEVDAALIGVSGNKRIAAGETQTLTFAVANYGMNELSDYKVVLTFSDGENTTDAEVSGTKALAAGEVSTLNYDIELNKACAGKTFTVNATVQAAGDTNEANNTADYQFYVKGSNLPAASNLEAEQDENGINLSWSAPVSDEITDPVVDGFDDYESFIIDGIGDWKVYDGDGAITVYFGGPSVPNNFDAKAWQVWAPEEAGFSLERFDVLTPHSGSKYIASWTASDGVSTTLPTDDWLISSDVQGGSDVNFYYRVPNEGSDPQNVELLYSNTDQQAESFQHVDGDQIVGTTAWVKLEYTLPEDAKYFAIRNWNDGNATTVAFIDDIEYTPLYGATTKLTFLGYNIYRDGQLIAEKVQETTYCDASSVGEHEYFVTAVWTEGESNATNVIEIEVITNISELVLGKEPVEFFSIDGRHIEGKVEPGIYLLRQGEKTAKVIIK